MIDSRPRTTYRGRIWRVVREGRDPMQFSRAGGRWTLEETDALYTSLDANGAVAEIHFRWWQVEPVPPSRIQAKLHELTIEISDVVRFDILDELVPLGVNVKEYSSLNYQRTREIGEATKFLGANALIAPNARWPCLNLIAYSLKNLDSLQILDAHLVDWDKWRAETRLIRRTKAGAREADLKENQRGRYLKA
ncbi:MAG TPA: RES family NAD+ phosphorylase [Candidatus Cybelea sp.]|nr:RES family NAD+ phosphorylase [Candidatus Cybelea sp.]